jgi:hypothetical protein
MPIENAETRRRLDEMALRISARLGIRQPHYRYFQIGRNGDMFCWTTERVDGKFISWVYKATGPGSRSDKAEHWKQTRKVEHSMRRAASARAERLFASAKKKAGKP